VLLVVDIRSFNNERASLPMAPRFAPPLANLRSQRGPPVESDNLKMGAILNRHNYDDMPRSLKNLPLLGTTHDALLRRIRGVFNSTH
jgi:hypothetical protein